MGGKTEGEKEVPETWLYLKEALLKTQEQAIPIQRKKRKFSKRLAWLNRELFTELKPKKES